MHARKSAREVVGEKAFTPRVRALLKAHLRRYAAKAERDAIAARRDADEVTAVMTPADLERFVEEHNLQGLILPGLGRSIDAYYRDFRETCCHCGKKAHGGLGIGNRFWCWRDACDREGSKVLSAECRKEQRRSGRRGLQKKRGRRRSRRRPRWR